MLIDAHTHLDRYGDAVVYALEEIRALRIVSLSNSMDIESYERNVGIATSCELVIPAFGVHPWNAPEYADKLENINEYIHMASVIGEVGLDHFFVDDASTYPAQQRVLEHALAAAVDQHKIVCLHTKGAEGDVVKTLRRFEPERAIVHWYSGPMDALEELIALGAYFTIGVEVLRSEQIQEIAQRLPQDRLLTETDNPGGWEWLAGEDGRPAILLDVVTELSRLLGQTSDEVAQAVRKNFLRLIGDDPGFARIISILEP